MNMMTWNDIIIDIENDNMLIDKLFGLSYYITHTIRTIWCEANEELNEKNKKVSGTECHQRFRKIVTRHCFSVACMEADRAWGYCYCS